MLDVEAPEVIEVPELLGELDAWGGRDARC